MPGDPVRTGLVARTAAESEEATEGRRRSGRVKHDAVRAVVHVTARGQLLVVTSLGRAFKTDVLPLPVLPEQAGTVSLRGGMSASELVPLHPGETVVGLAPLGGPPQGSPGLALGTRQGVVKVCAPEWPVRSDEFEVIALREGDEVVGATWLADARGDPRVRRLRRVAAAVPRGTGPPAGPQGRRHGRHQPRRGCRGDVLRRDPYRRPAARRADGGHLHRPGGEGHPVRGVPRKGRATGGVRVQRFLKGDARLVLAWIGPRPAAASRTGDPVELPAPDPRRDGSGTAMAGPDVVGHLIDRD